MAPLPLRFADEFRLAGDPQTLLIDFWSFLNASQSALDWGSAADRVWDLLEEMERELEDGEPTFSWLASVADRWQCTGNQERREAGAMLAEALALKGQ